MSPEQIKSLLSAYRIRPTKGKGQHFLLDESVVERMIEAAQITKEDTVLEIGPGLGILTNQLIRRAGKVVSVELDAQVATFARVEFATAPNFTLIESDILNLRPAVIREAAGDRYALVANLPYAITAPVLEKFLSTEPRPELMVVMVQKEVAQRITAAPGELSVLGVAVQYYAEVELLEIVPRTKFFPVPEVDSAVVRLKVKSQLPASTAEFFRIVRIGFSARRKQLHNNLSAGLRITSAEAKKLIADLGLREDIRPQQLSVGQWKRLAEQCAAVPP